MALVLYRPLFWVLLAALGLALLWVARRVRLRWLLAWPLRFAFAGAILFIIFSPRGELFGDDLPPKQVLVLDLSDSVPAGVQQAMQEQARPWQAAAPNRLVLAYGRETAPLLSAEAPWPEIDGRASRLAPALEKAVALLGETPGHVLLASDGVADDAVEVDAFADRLAGLGHRLDVIPLPTADAADDVILGPLAAPAVLWENTPFAVVVPVLAQEAGQVTVRLQVNGQLLDERSERVSPGENAVVFSAQANGQGIVTLAASASAEGDPRPENNRAFATAQVFPPPRVLFVSKEEENAFAQALGERGLPVETLPPRNLPTDLELLQDYDVVFVDNLLSRDLTREQMLGLKLFVNRRGGGLVFLGGRNSFTLGDYQNTPLAEILPVKLEAPSRQERPPVTFILIFDRSESMGTPQPFVEPIVLAQEAAMRALEVFNPDDHVGVMTYASDVVWEVPVRPVGTGLGLRESQDAISQVDATGTTQMFSALSEAVAVLQEARPTESTLILLLSDGQSKDGSFEEFEALARTARNQGISISTIALGAFHEATDLMEMIADEADGRYHLVLEPSELPRIMIAEGRAARGENVQEGEVGLVAEEVHPVLFGFNPGNLPPLAAYNALTSRADEGAENILLSAGLRDPLLSAWQVGLGRVVAWMGDGGQEWATAWASWPEAGRFWSQVVRYAQLNPALGPAVVDVQSDGGQLAVQVRLQTELGVPLNGLDPEFAYADGDDVVHSYALPQVGPGLYELEAPLPPAGAYRAVVRYPRGETVVETPAPFAVNYPAEWRPADGGAGAARLREWAQATGGGESTLAAAPAEVMESSARETAQSLFEWLLPAFVLYWLGEIAIRRRWLPWR